MSITIINQNINKNKYKSLSLIAHFLYFSLNFRSLLCNSSSRSFYFCAYYKLLSIHFLKSVLNEEFDNKGSI